MPIEMLKVYIVIVNYNGWKDTIECLESVLKSSYSNYQVIVVDNSANDESWNKIMEWASNSGVIETLFPEIILPLASKPFSSFRALDETELIRKQFSEKILLVKSKHNHGFSAANNIGLRYALQCNDFEYAWLLNNDTIVQSDTLQHLASYMSDKNASKVGILGSKVLEYFNSSIIQNAGGGKLYRPVAYSVLIGANAPDSGQYDVAHIPMDFVAGTSMFVRKQFLIEVGLLSEDYFLYFEEPDWAERGRKLGWQLGYCYLSKVFHKGGASTGGKGYSSAVKSSTSFSDYYFQRSKVLFTKKFYPFWLPVLYLSFVLVIFNRMRRGQFDRLKLLLSILIHPNKPYPGRLKN
jgi:GT2 family glycosyltransferase